MKCPLREDMLGRMPECESDCAWRVGDECAVQLNLFPNYQSSLISLQRQIDDLMSEDDTNDTFSPKKIVSGNADTSNDNSLSLEQDTREKLEADVRKRFPGSYYDVLEFCDRQASITRAELVDCAACPITERIAELKAERDNLIAHPVLVHTASLTVESAFKKLIKERDDLRAERNDYRRRLADIQEIANFPLCLDYHDHEEVDA